MQITIRSISCVVLVALGFDCVARPLIMRKHEPVWHYHHTSQNIHIKITELTRRQATRQLGANAYGLFNKKNLIMPLKLEITNKGLAPLIISDDLISLPYLSSYELYARLYQNISFGQKCFTFLGKWWLGYLCYLLLLIAVIPVIGLLLLPWGGYMAALYVGTMLADAPWATSIAVTAAAVYAGHAAFDPTSLAYSGLLMPKVPKPHIIAPGKCHTEYIFVESTKFVPNYTVEVQHGLYNPTMKLLPVTMQQVIF